MILLSILLCPMPSPVNLSPRFSYQHTLNFHLECNNFTLSIAQLEFTLFSSICIKTSDSVKLVRHQTNSIGLYRKLVLLLTEIYSMVLRCLNKRLKFSLSWSLILSCLKLMICQPLCESLVVVWCANRPVTSRPGVMDMECDEFWGVRNLDESSPVTTCAVTPPGLVLCTPRPSPPTSRNQTARSSASSAACPGRRN